MENINKLIEIFDNYLLQNNRSFIGLRTGNELIKNSDDEEIRNIDLKKTLELGLIPNSSLINTTKRQWRIYLSKSAEEKPFQASGSLCQIAFFTTSETRSILQCRCDSQSDLVYRTLSALRAFTD